MIKTLNWSAVVLLAMVALSRGAESVTRDTIDNVRTTLEKWVETQRVISKERQEWALGREILKERIELVEHQIVSIREKIDQAQENIDRTDQQRVELTDENETLKQATALLGDIIARFEARTLALNQRLPDTLRDRIKRLSQSLPENPADTKLSLAQRFMNVVGILNEVNKFNRDITVTSEVRTLADGSVAEVTAVYVGLGQAYYVGANGTVAGVGYADADGWRWQPANEMAAQIGEAVAILKNEKVAGFVLLPVTIK
jgi:hypothetical protein